MNSNKKLIVFMLVAVLFVLAVGCAQEGDKVVAKVNGENIYQSEVDKLMEKVKASAKNSGIDLESEEAKQALQEYQLKIVESLIEEKFIEQLAEEQNVKIADEKITEQVNKEIAALKEQMGEEEFKKCMEEYKLTEEDIREQIYFQMLQEKLYDQVVSDVEVSDSQVKEYYEKNQESLEKIMVRHILFMAEEGKASEEDKNKALERAEEVIAKLEKGADFAELAKEYSEEPGAEQSGGLIPQFITRNSPLVQPFLEAAFLLDEGQYSKEPVKTRYGYHVIKVDKKKESYEELKDEIKTSLLELKQNEKFSKYYMEKREAAEIENIFEKELENKQNQEKENNQEKINQEDTTQ